MTTLNDTGNLRVCHPVLTSSGCASWATVFVFEMEPSVLHFQFNPAGSIPNNPRLPVLVYKGAFGQVPDPKRAETIEKHIVQHGWQPAWRWGVYDFAHYHSTAHEFLGVFRGRASLRLGHDSGITLVVEAGDVLVLPAGTGHQNLGSSDDFEVVGAYPNGQHADLIRAEQSDRLGAEQRIAKVPLPAGDPISGRTGALVQYWKLPT